MKEDNLTENEKSFELGLVSIASFTLVVLIVAMINELKAGSWFGLAPTFTASCSLFFLVCGIGAFSKMALMKKWTPFSLFELLQFVFRKTDSDEKIVEQRSFISLGILYIIFAIAMFILTIKISINSM